MYLQEILRKKKKGKNKQQLKVDTSLSVQKFKKLIKIYIFLFANEFILIFEKSVADI